MHVVLDTNWLAYYIIGPTLAGKTFIHHQFDLLHPSSTYTKEELSKFYAGVAEFPTLSQLLESLEIMVTFDGRNYIIPTKIPPERRGRSASEFTKGRSIFCADSRSMVSPGVFPIIQTKLMKAFGSEIDQPTLTTQSVQFAKQTIALEKQLNGRDAINFAIDYQDMNAELCYEDLNRMTNIIVLTMYEISPGTSIETGKNHCAGR